MKRIGTMKKQEFVWAIAVALLAALPTFAQQPAGKTSAPPASPASKAASEPAASSVVLKVGNESVTKGDIDYLLGTLSPQAQKSVESRGKRSVGDQYVVMMVLYQAGLGEHLDQSEPYRKEMTQHRRQVLAQLEYQRLLSKVQITQPEIGQYYSSHADEFREAKVRQVAIRLKAEGGGASGQGLTVEQAQAKATEIRGALASGLDPAKVAQQYAVPNEVVISADPQTIEDTPRLPPFVKEVFSLGIGQFTKPAQASGALVMLQVTGQSKMSLTDASSSIEQTLRQQKMESQLAAMKTKANIWMDQAYFGPEPASSSAAYPANSAGAPAGQKP
ncbi:MAG: peptidylprolyl isomerase [Terriglobia bacterium]